MIAFKSSPSAPRSFCKIPSSAASAGFAAARFKINVIPAATCFTTVGLVFNPTPYAARTSAAAPRRCTAIRIAVTSEYP